jgi:iron complex outermembrane recepter protein
MRTQCHTSAIKVSLLRAGCVGLGALLVGPAMAQEAAEPLEEVVITGSNIRGTAPIGNSLQLLDAADIADSGKATVAELLRELPVNFAGGVATGDNNRAGQDNSSGVANLTGGSGVNLRGLGALSTLVLVDGRRVATAGQFGDFVDISNIPVAAIERVEILQDGASAVYGSDAVGGVVNLILKKRTEGFETLARFGTQTRGGGDELQASAVWGGQLGRVSTVLGYEFNDRGRVEASDRGFASGNFSSRGGINWPIYTSRAGASANLFAAGAAFNGAVAFTVPAGAGTGLTLASLTPAAGGFGNSFDPWAGWDILPEMRRHSLFVNASADVGERLDLRGAARYTQRDGDYRTGFPVIFSTLPATSPFFITGNANNFGVVVDDRVTQREVGVDSYAADLGGKYSLGGDWAVDLALSYSREEQNRKSQLLRDTNILDRVVAGATTAAAPSPLTCSLSGLNPTNIATVMGATPAQQYCAALNYTPFNPYTLQALPEAVLSQLVGYEDLDFDSQLTQATLTVDGTLFEVGGGAAKAAIGLDYRRERIDGLLDFNYRSTRAFQVPYGVTDRTVRSAFAELAVPVIGAANAGAFARALDVSLAVRHEKSTGLGDYSSTDPKIGIRFKPVDALTIRASYGTSFHAPPMRFAYDGPQPVPGGNAIFYANAFYTAPCNTTLVTLNGFTGTPGAPTGSCTFTGMVVSGGAGAVLKPEEADTWTIGLEFAPERVPGLQLSANYFNLEVENRLVRITAGTLAGILANYFATGSSPYAANLVFNPSLGLQQQLFNDPRFTGLAGPGPARVPGQVAAIIYATQTNLAALKTDGIDVTARYGWSTGVGDFEAFLNGTLVKSYDLQATPGAPFVDRLGRYESTGNPIELRSRQGLAWKRGGWSARATVNYTDDYVCEVGCFVPSATGAPVTNSSPLKIDAWTTVDLNVAYDFAQESGLFAGAGISLSVLNAFDEDPPFIDTGRIVTGNAPEPYDGTNATINGRAVSLTITKRF